MIKHVFTATEHTLYHLCNSTISKALWILSVLTYDYNLLESKYLCTLLLRKPTLHKATNKIHYVKSAVLMLSINETVQ